VVIPVTLPDPRTTPTMVSVTRKARRPLNVAPTPRRVDSMSAARDTSALVIARASRTPMRLLMETMMTTTRTTRPYATPRRRTSASWNVMRRTARLARSSAARSVARSAVRGPMVAVPPATRVGQLDRQPGDPQAPPLQPGRNLAAMVLPRAKGLALCSCVCLSSATLKIY